MTKKILGIARIALNIRAEYLHETCSARASENGLAHAVSQIHPLWVVHYNDRLIRRFPTELTGSKDDA